MDRALCLPWCQLSTLTSPSLLLDRSALPLCPRVSCLFTVFCGGGGGSVMVWVPLSPHGLLADVANNSS